MTIGETIRQLRNERGFSQEKLAEMLHVSRSAVAKWETDGGVPEIDNLLQLSAVFGVSIDELVGNAAGTGSKPAEAARDFGSGRYDIELTGWNDGVYGVCLLAEDPDFLYYYQDAAKGRGVYGLIGRKHITSVLPAKGKAAEPPAQAVGRSFFCGRPAQITLAKREGLLRGLLDFRGDAYRRVVIDSFGRDALRLQFGGTLPLADIARIEELGE